MIKTLEDLQEVLRRVDISDRSKRLTAVEVVEAFRLFRRLEAEETDPVKKARFRESKQRFKMLAKMRSDTRRMRELN